MIKDIKDLKIKIREGRNRWLSLREHIKYAEEKLNTPSLFSDRDLVNRSFGNPSLSGGGNGEEGSNGGESFLADNPDSFYVS